MKRILMRVLAVLSGAAVVLGTAGIGPAQAAAQVSGIDVPGACVYFYGAGYTPKIVGTTAYDWRCTNGTTEKGIDMPAACQYQRESVNVVDRIGNFNDVYSWQCWSTVNGRPSGGLDLNGYCQSIGYQTAKAIGSTAYDWRCVNFGGALGPIDTTRACRHTYGGLAIDRFRNFYDRNSWECYV
jgi:hypothetical protein